MGRPDPSPRTGADPTLDEILEVLSKRDLPISEADAHRLLPSVRRTRAMAAEVRRMFEPDVAPAGSAPDAPERPA